MRIKNYREIDGESKNIINVYVIKYLYFKYKSVTLTECTHQTVAKRQSSALSQTVQKVASMEHNFIEDGTISTFSATCGTNMCGQRNVSSTESAFNLDLSWIMTFF